jgi:hypothetical protein
MEKMLSLIRKHKFKAHLIAFTLMILSSIGMYFAIDSGSASLIWALLGGFVLANILAIFIK